MPMALRIIKPGLQASIQDAGRWGHQQDGVPVSGAMDRYAMRVANLLCGNDADLPVLEIAWHGLQLIAESEILIAYAGGGAALDFAGQSLPAGRPLLVPAFSLLTFTPSPTGLYTYLAVGGGFQAHVHLGSASTFIPSALGGLEGRALRSGDVLQVMSMVPEREKKLAHRLRGTVNGVAFPSWSFDLSREPYQNTEVRLTRGPEWDWFDGLAQAALLADDLCISPKSNRMATRLDGLSLARVRQDELLSSAVCRGTMQVMHDGSPLVLMADAQTTGGYPRIAQVAAADLDRFAQARPGSLARFRMISATEAENVYLARESMIRQAERAIVWKLDSWIGS
jgi:antagonist of KipI